MSNTAPVSETTHIAKNTTVKGEIRLEGPATIAGRIEGGVFGKEVEVVADGTVEGDIACNSIDLNGNVKGNVTAAKSCKLGATARVAGEVRTANLSISEGAVFVGQVFVGGSALSKAGESSSNGSTNSDNVSIHAANVQNTLNRNNPNKVAARPLTGVGQ